MDTKRGATSAAAHRAASNNSRGGGGVYTRAGSKTAPATGTGGRKRAAKADSTDVAKTLRVLKSDLAAALERTMGKVETECGEIGETGGKLRVKRQIKLHRCFAPARCF